MAFSVDLGEIAVTIGMDTRGVEKGSKKVDGLLKRTSDKLKKSASKWAKWGLGIATAVAAAGAVLLKFRAAAIDTLAKTSDKLGIATEKLAGLRLAAEQTGVSAGTMDMALQRMTRRIAEAAEGSGEAKKAIAELGINAQALGKLTPDQQFRTLADAMEKVEFQGDRVRLGFKLFDSEGVALINTLRGGTKSLDAFQKQAEKLGLAISRKDAAGIERMNDTLNLATKSLEGGLNIALIKLAPIVDALAKAFNDMALDADTLGKTVDTGITQATRVLGVFADGLQGIRILFKGVEVAGRGFISLLLFGFAQVSKAVSAVGNALVENLVKPLKVVLQVLAPINQQAADMLGNFDNFVEGLKSNLGQQASAFADSSINALRAAKEEMHDLMLEPLASDRIAAFVDDAQRKFEEAIAANPPIDLTGGGADVNNKDLFLTEAGEVDPFIQSLLDSMDTEEELENQRYAAKLERLRMFKEEELAIIGGLAEAEALLAQEHSDNLVAIREAEESAKRQIIIGGITDLLSAMSSGGKRMTKLQENIAVTNAGIKGIQAAVDAWQAGMSVGGPWAPAVAAAYMTASLIKTGSLISQIKSGGKGGGGGGGGIPSVNRGGSVPGGTPAGAGGGSQAPQNRRIDINLVGEGLLSTDQVRELIGQINDQVGDGVDLIAGD